MPSYVLSINGKDVPVEAPEDMPLVWVLRDLLHLTGTKFGCGIAQCRACTVIMDGAPALACMVPVAKVGSAKITTIEGLAAEGSLHTVQRVWLEEEVAQCGYCQPGQILAAHALLLRNRKPTDADIDEAMSGNLCRCGTYPRIRRAIHRAAQELGEDKR